MARYTPTYIHIAGHSAYDHMAREVISIATACTADRTYATRSGARRAGDREVTRAFRLALGRPAVAPRIDVDAQEVH